MFFFLDAFINKLCLSFWLTFFTCVKHKDNWKMVWNIRVFFIIPNMCWMPLITVFVIRWPIAVAVLLVTRVGFKKKKNRWIVDFSNTRRNTNIEHWENQQNKSRKAPKIARLDLAVSLCLRLAKNCHFIYCFVVVGKLVYQGRYHKYIIHIHATSWV